METQMECRTANRMESNVLTWPAQHQSGTEKIAMVYDAIDHLRGIFLFTGVKEESRGTLLHDREGLLFVRRKGHRWRYVTSSPLGGGMGESGWIYLLADMYLDHFHKTLRMVRERAEGFDRMTLYYLLTNNTAARRGNYKVGVEGIGLAWLGCECPLQGVMIDHDENGWGLDEK
eukprot:TRINITY_DN2646_c0_g1_i1.p1 TRINITY_DN2646_c0_g1~~TRINITY_DN2646_c0_g1_i1.p1  ORF type:complete len:174 (-),score=27.35 TRINITY_DN2646_c0_g1_i1:371-892(-)